MFARIAHAAGVIDDAPRLSEIAFAIMQVLLGIVSVVAVIGILFGAISYFFFGSTEAGAQRSLLMIKSSLIGLTAVLLSLIILNGIGYVVG